MAALDEEERAHLEELRGIDRRNLRILERQIRSYGEDDAPQHMIARRDELREKLGLAGKMVRGEFTEEILDMFRQFGERQSLSRAIADVDKQLYDFKKETWAYRERESIARQERQVDTDKRFERIEDRLQWAFWIVLVILGAIIWIAARSY